MTPGQFLRLVWPDEGFYCIAHPFKPEGSDKTLYMHKVFPTISEAVSHCYEMEHRADTFFAVLSLREEKIWSPTKPDYRTGQPGAYAVRTQENMLASKALFFDLDVGPDEAKYPTQRDALIGLVAFMQATKLPLPSLVSSGGGVHAYWHLDTALPVDQWRLMEWRLRCLAEHHGLKFDPTRTIDSTSVLRVPGTNNWKDRSNPRPVKVLETGDVSSVPALDRVISDAVIAAGLTPGNPPVPGKAKAPVADADGFEQQTFNDFGPPPTVAELGSICAQVREVVASQVNPAHAHYGKLEQNRWYKGMISLLGHAEDGPDTCRKLTALFPRNVSNVDAKLEQSSHYPPTKCETLQQIMPWKDTPCQTCKFRNDPSVPNPYAATRKGLAAPPPSASPSTPSSPSPSSEASPSSPSASSCSPTSIIVASPPSFAMQAAMIPNPPAPWARVKAGGISLTRTDKDGNESVSIIYENDLYPLKRLVNVDGTGEQQLWRVTLPRVGAREFLLDADALYDGKKFASAMSNNGVYPHKADLPALQDYMVAYISQLQKDLDADSQLAHLGWTDDHRQFVLPDKTLCSDGTVRASALTKGAERAAQHISKKGTLEAQVALMAFYDKPEYRANQFAVLAALGSIIFYPTGHHGVVINLSGEAGASKSTTLYTGASLWANPKLWPINGTQRGATANARAQRIMTNANLPTCVDEITHLPARDAIDLVMNITQPGHRLRLATDGVERQTADGYKSAIMIATANSSLHSLLSTDSAAGTAGSMRVFEMKVTAQKVHTKAEADEFLRQLEQNYGHIGEVFASWVVRNRELVEMRVQHWVRVIDERGRITSAERFWSAVVAAVLTTAEIAKALGLLPYDADELAQWVIEHQIPHMRGVVVEEYRDPVAVLTDYIADKQGNIVVVDRAPSIGINTAGQGVVSDQSFAINRPSGALLGHYDIRTGTLVLLKQGFKDHCSAVGASASRLLDELSTPRSSGTEPPRRVVIERNVRRTLGKGTPLAKGQAYCFVVDMKHPDIAGIQPTLVASNDQTDHQPKEQLA